MSVSLYRSVAGQYEKLRTVNTVSMMNAISHEIEDQVIEHGMPVNFYAGFQRFSSFPSQLRRYGKLGAACRRVYAFGVRDIKPPTIPGVEFIAIEPSSPLAKEWFLVVDAPNFWTALLTQETTGRDALGAGRRFDGVWTYDQQVVERASLLISQELEGFYQPVAQRDHGQQSTHIAEISGRMVASLETAKHIGHRRWLRMNCIQAVAAVLAKRESLHNTVSGVAEVLHSLFGASEVAIALTEGDTLYTARAPQASSSVVQGNDLGAGPCGRALAEGTLVRVNDVRRSREHEQLLPMAQTIVAAPIISSQSTCGVVAIGGADPEQWSEEDAEMVLAVATMLGLSCEQGGQYTDVVKEQERMRRLEQALISLRKPVAQLLSVEQLLRDQIATMQPSWDMLASINVLSKTALGMAQMLGVPHDRLTKSF